jgi:5-methyltetrahydrofolate--homocysteine methyltransferase
MDKQIFRQRIDNEILIMDGAMGTMLQSQLPPGLLMDVANIELPDLVKDVHTAYSKAGADIVLTNTLGANRIKLKKTGFEDKINKINFTAAKLAKKAVGEDVWVAGCIGPTGKLVEPMGPLTFDETYETFHEQAMALAEGGVDLFILETFSDLKEIKIAVIAIKEVTNLPIIASMTFDDGFLSFTGTNPETAANVLTSLGVDSVGVNCSTGPEPMLEIVGRYAMVTELPIAVEPNAGIPSLNDKHVLYNIYPDKMTNYGEKFIDLGANIIGTCCGSTPEYTAKLRKGIKNRKPLSRKINPCLRISSRVKTIEIGNGLPFCIIGERINPTNRDDLVEVLNKGQVSLLQKEAQNQTDEGAHLLDLNIGVPGIDEVNIMEKVVRGIENVVETPLTIDSVNPSAIETALRESPGKVLINSVNGDEKSLKSILPLASRFGAGVLCLAVGEKGIPKTAEERLTILKKIVTSAKEHGISRQDLICDCLTLTVSAQQKRAEETLKAIRLVKEEMNLPTVLGVSNISYGLPDRSLINSTFLSMAMASGLDAAIMNSGDARMMGAVRAASVLTVRDKDSKEFVKSHQKKKKSAQNIKDDKNMIESEGEKIYHAIISGNRDEISDLVKDALDADIKPASINDDILIPAIQNVGQKYDRKELYLPQMILAAETMQKAFKVLEPHFEKGDVKIKGKIVICTVKGDVHDIGKNIVALFLKNYGFQVYDLGKNVSAEMIVDKTLELKADIVGLSALMTTTMVEMSNVIEKLKKTGSNASVIVGGAVVTKRYAAEIGAEAYAKDGFTAVEAVKALID